MNMPKVDEFTTVSISLASPEQVLSWSYGEVTKPETINYRTLKPAKDGLFCEKIFGPTRDFECYCGKYKKAQYEGVVCDRCGVVVTRSEVRRERMGIIKLAAPVAHIWFMKGAPSRIGLLLGISPRSLEKVLYFVQYIVTSVDEAARDALVQQMREDYLRQHGVEGQDAEEGADEELASSDDIEEGDVVQDIKEEWVEDGEESQPESTMAKQPLGDEELEVKIAELESIHPLMLLTETKHQELKEKCGHVFEAEMGAEAILVLLRNLNLEELRDVLWQEMDSYSGQRRKKAMKRLEIVESFLTSGNKPEWMILTALPVLPPDLRPMVQLDGGRFATADLNDLYRRVINRNNRLKRLLELDAPQIIIRNEKRMLQEAVDSLIDNVKRGKGMGGAGNRPLKSLSDMLRGKQGRFRQNLLGKRVDYSGRSVIIVGPELKLHQCGIPKRMALELFKPFVMSKLVQQGIAANIKSAKRMVDRSRSEVWDILEDVVKDRPVLLNRAPTLHRLGIQAFEPVLIEGSAIRIHPLVCTAFNADFDGDQMAVHVPLSKLAVREAREVMLSSQNLRLPSNGEPCVTPTLDIVLGCYYLTSVKSGASGEGTRFGSIEEAKLAYELGATDLRAEIEVREPESGERIRTTTGRIIFNEMLPEGLDFINEVADKGRLRRLISQCIRLFGNETAAEVADSIKRLGFEYATKSGTTISAFDIREPVRKSEILREAEEQVERMEDQYHRGLITDDERYNAAVEVWNEATDRITEAVTDSLDHYGGVYMMAVSGAKGNVTQIRQMAGMRGLMTDPVGKIIDFPIKNSFREGLPVLEYFISTHGARKGLADTALRTSDSGYLTRRLVDVAQGCLISETDCGTTYGIWLTQSVGDSLLPSLEERLVGRFAAKSVVEPHSKQKQKKGKIIVDRNEEIDEEKARAICSAGVTEVYVRSPLTCQSRRGMCQYCYGRDLGRGKLVDMNTAVGVIAAQSIGEPGTQLTLRTFHTGGVVGLDITSGLPRVEELFEARVPKGQAVISEIDGEVEILDTGDGRRIRITNSEEYHDMHALPPGAEPLVSDGDYVEVGTLLAQQPESEASQEEEETALAPTQQLLARVAGRVSVEDDHVLVNYVEMEEREYPIPMTALLQVQSGDRVMVGDQLIQGHVNPQDILRISGKEAVQRYLVDDVQKVYRSQGVSINDKHIEAIVSQMLGKVCIDSPGDTGLLPGRLVNTFEYEDANARVLAEGGEPATAQTVLLGITKASLNSDSFLAAASFQETTRVLTDAALGGRSDPLLGLKENVVIGRLIPARCLPDEPEELGMPQLEPGVVGSIEAEEATAEEATAEEATAEEATEDVSVEDDSAEEGPAAEEIEVSP
jgi:DNA-directed RNA polymerase subunit beta'